MASVTIAGVALHYEERGSGTPIVGVHGAGSSAVFWEDAADRLAGLGRVITYDRRGSWRSGRPTHYPSTSVREQADDLRALLQALHAEPAIVVGRSYGGTIGLELALRHPEAVRGLALLEAGPNGLSAEYDAWFASLAETCETTAADRGAHAVGEVVVREVFGAWEELPDAWREVFTHNGPALLAELRGGERLSHDVRLESLRTPALIVSSEDSPEPLQRANDALQRALPQARAVRVSGGHAIDPAGREVLAFVEEVLSERAPT